jgi:hypothetical protein
MKDWSRLESTVVGVGGIHHFPGPAVILGVESVHMADPATHKEKDYRFGSRRHVGRELPTGSQITLIAKIGKRGTADAKAEVSQKAAPGSEILM